MSKSRLPDNGRRLRFIPEIGPRRDTEGFPEGSVGEQYRDRLHASLRARGREWLEGRSADSFEVLTAELPEAPFAYLAELLLSNEDYELRAEELEVVVDSPLRHLALMELVAEHTGPLNHHYVEWAGELKDIALRKLMPQRNVVESLFANMEKLNELADSEFEERERQEKAVFPIARQ